MVQLSNNQIDAVDKMHNGCILCGGVGSGKSRTSLYYYILDCKGSVPVNNKDEFRDMKEPRDLYIITTAKKRNSKEWIEELIPFHIFVNDIENSRFPINVTIDSWNNIKKYKKVTSAFFIFDEQRVVGSGAWVKAFLDIARKNRWVLLSATPGDVWSDYRPVFIANGFYANKTDFDRKHVIWSRHSNYPKIEGYYDQGVLIRHRNDVLVLMKSEHENERHNIIIPTNYDKNQYKFVWKNRWNIYKDEPIKQASELFYTVRRLVNTDPSRVVALTELLESNPKTIIFYNFDYELEIICNVCEMMQIPYSMYNGHQHQDIIGGDNWCYIVQYSAGSEAWNCIETNVIIFYSQTYSYKTLEQASGRIDRRNTEFKDLYYYHLRSSAPIDLAIKRAINNKRNFNESAYLRENDSRQNHSHL